MKIRIAVAAKQDGEWVASGWGSRSREPSDKAKMDCAISGLGSYECDHFIIEADLPLPEYTTIKGVMVEEKEEKIT